MKKTYEIQKFTFISVSIVKEPVNPSCRIDWTREEPTEGN